MCYHCHKPFRAKIFPYVLIEAVVLAAICVVINILALTRMNRLMLVPLFLITLVFLLLIWLLVPYFTKFKKEEEKKNNKER